MNPKSGDIVYLIKDNILKKSTILESDDGTPGNIKLNRNNLIKIKKIHEKDIYYIDDLKMNSLIASEIHPINTIYELEKYIIKKLKDSQQLIPTQKYFGETGIVEKTIGLSNNGNTCFINSAIQFIHSINLFRDYILDLDTKSASKLTKALQMVFKLMKYTPSTFINLINERLEDETLYDILRGVFHLSPKHDNNSYDCSEYLINLINALREEDLHENNKIFNLFLIDSFEFLNCVNDEKVVKKNSLRRSSHTRETHIQINASNKGDSIIELLNTYLNKQKSSDDQYIDYCTGFNNLFKTESVEEYQYEDVLNEKTCETTRESKRTGKQIEKKSYGKTRYTQNILIPNDCNRYLIINLNRFNDYGLKNTRIITIDKNIQLYNRHYIITSVCVHSGNLDGGHYVWYKYDHNGLLSNLISDASNTHLKTHNPLYKIDESTTILLYRYISTTDKKFIDKNLDFFIEDTNLYESLNTGLDPTEMQDKKVEIDKISKCSNTPKFVVDKSRKIKYLKYKEKYLKLKIMNAEKNDI